MEEQKVSTVSQVIFQYHIFLKISKVKAIVFSFLLLSLKSFSFIKNIVVLSTYHTRTFNKIEDSSRIML